MLYEPFKMLNMVKVWKFKYGKVQKFEIVKEP